VAVVRRTGALDAARQVARDEAASARACLRHLPASVQRDALLELCARSVDRSS
jgi:octaprenyl-diphosphate synthase